MVEHETMTKLIAEIDGARDEKLEAIKDIRDVLRRIADTLEAACLRRGLGDQEVNRRG